MLRSVHWKIVTNILKEFNKNFMPSRKKLCIVDVAQHLIHFTISVCILFSIKTYST